MKTKKLNEKVKKSVNTYRMEPVIFILVMLIGLLISLYEVNSNINEIILLIINIIGLAIAVGTFILIKKKRV